jgi:hypothetical protein
LEYIGRIWVDKSDPLLSRKKPWQCNTDFGYFAVVASIFPKIFSDCINTAGQASVEQKKRDEETAQFRHSRGRFMDLLKSLKENFPRLRFDQLAPTSTRTGLK